jgi:hypothetical protein
MSSRIFGIRRGPLRGGLANPPAEQVGLADVGRAPYFAGSFFRTSIQTNLAVNLITTVFSGAVVATLPIGQQSVSQPRAAVGQPAQSGQTNLLLLSSGQPPVGQQLVSEELPTFEAPQQQQLLPFFPGFGTPANPPPPFAPAVTSPFTQYSVARGFEGALFLGFFPTPQDAPLRGASWWQPGVASPQQGPAQADWSLLRTATVEQKPQGTGWVSQPQAGYGAQAPQLQPNHLTRTEPKPPQPSLSVPLFSAGPQIPAVTDYFLQRTAPPLVPPPFSTFSLISQPQAFAQPQIAFPPQYLPLLDSFVPPAPAPSTGNFGGGSGGYGHGWKKHYPEKKQKTARKGLDELLDQVVEKMEAPLKAPEPAPPPSKLPAKAPLPYTPLSPAPILPEEDDDLMNQAIIEFFFS